MGERWHAANARLLHGGLHDRRAARAWLSSRSSTVCVRSHRGWPRRGSRVRIGLGKNCGWTARSIQCERRRIWHISNRWMSFILPVWQRTQNTTTATRIDSPPFPLSSMLASSPAQRGCVRLHKYCQPTLSCRGRGVASACAHYAHAFGLCGGAPPRHWQYKYHPPSG